MNRTRIAAVAFGVAAAVAPLSDAPAHGIAGDRVFPATLTIDDPAVGDELSLPTFSYTPNGPTQTFVTGFEWDKTITEDFGININGAYSIIKQAQPGFNAYGFQDFIVTAKYHFVTIPQYEFMASAGIIRDLDKTGADRVGSSGTGLTTPTLYYGKGFGELPIGLLRPLALTGTIGYQFADRPTRNSIAPDGTLQTTQTPNLLVIGNSIQYHMSYLKSQVKDYDLPDFVNNLIPLVEFSLSTPVTRSNGVATVGFVAPGVLYEAGSFQVGVEMLIPATKFSGRGIGAIAQVHFFLDDIFPNSIGKPLVELFQ